MHRLYRHRVNTIPELDATPASLGIEFDLRSDGDQVIVTHDPFTSGPRIEEFFPRIGARPCIFNVKCEGVEERVVALARAHAIQDFFFLDCSVPAAVKLWRSGERRFAVRWSEHEPFEGAIAWAGKATWCWVDCFTRFPGSDVEWARIASEFQVCLVSPELQGHGAEAIPQFRAALGARHFHAACSKRPDLWSERHE
ncbi:MAG TPA: hypothetical protein VJV78_07425 [Polyangiales bacterium]|nr:hypothetical protein [Polyangiales bacterium]